MTLHELKTTLIQHREKGLRLLLPNGDQVPVAFHITEVGRVRKTFMDCGGRLHEAETCQLQAWVGGDADHRIEAGKVASILEKAAAILSNPQLPVEIEYGDATVSQYPVLDCALGKDAVILRLAAKHTDCLAQELCGTSAPGAAGDTKCCASKCGCN